MREEFDSLESLVDDINCGGTNRGSRQILK